MSLGARDLAIVGVVVLLVLVVVVWFYDAFTSVYPAI